MSPVEVKLKPKPDSFVKQVQSWGQTLQLPSILFPGQPEPPLQWCVTVLSLLHCLAPEMFVFNGHFVLLFLVGHSTTLEAGGLGMAR